MSDGDTKAAIEMVREALERFIGNYVDDWRDVFDALDRITTALYKKEQAYANGVEAESERLRAEVKGLENLRALVDRDTRERERYREALEVLLIAICDAAGNLSSYSTHDAAVRAAVDVARTALSAP
jgi:hypothetical protein